MLFRYIELILNASYYPLFYFIELIFSGDYTRNLILLN